jgi:hypothetical protein
VMSMSTPPMKFLSQLRRLVAGGVCAWRDCPPAANKCQLFSEILLSTRFNYLIFQNEALIICA